MAGAGNAAPRSGPAGDEGRPGRADLREMASFTAGVGPLLKGTYTLVDQPGGGVAVIWSWHFGQGRPHLGGNREFIDSLRIG